MCEETFQAKCYTVGSIWVCRSFRGSRAPVSGNTWYLKCEVKDSSLKGPLSPHDLSSGDWPARTQNETSLSAFHDAGPRPKMLGPQLSRFPSSDSFVKKSRPESDHSFGVSEVMVFTVREIWLLRLSAALSKTTTTKCTNWHSVSDVSYFDSSAFSGNRSSKSKCLLG